MLFCPVVIDSKAHIIPKGKQESLGCRISFFHMVFLGMVEEVYGISIVSLYGACDGFMSSEQPTSFSECASSVRQLNSNSIEKVLTNVKIDEYLVN